MNFPSFRRPNPFFERTTDGYSLKVVVNLKAPSGLVEGRATEGRETRDRGY